MEENRILVWEKSVNDEHFLLHCSCRMQFDVNYLSSLKTTLKNNRNTEEVCVCAVGEVAQHCGILLCALFTLCKVICRL